MNLNTQHLAEVLSVMMPKTSPDQGSDKRRAARLHVESQVTIWHIQDGVPGPAVKVLTRDISLSGVGFLETTAPGVGSEFLMQLPRAKQQPVLLVCRVKFARPLADHLFMVGAEFVRTVAQAWDGKAGVTDLAGVKGDETLVQAAGKK